ncbi:hypothetical protein FHS39_002515 [Streptomyces olivoverticillatus]|uniref:Uncharacterized protein n=1 Tax=Streptomyces olivoverticillatus TaxID=66427 RepID=A0A7W7LNG0_9ACTN|nr:hypothetical protein [Streptomyces olivoverticillatus]MBB4893484.1 hypothetical protein [Streptomyces olivoverticillatus]
MATTTDPRLATALLFDELQQAQTVADGRLAEQRHFLDADPDTAVPCPGIPHPKPVEASRDQS